MQDGRRDAKRLPWCVGRPVTASSCPDVGTVFQMLEAVTVWCSVCLQVVKFFYQWSNFLTGSQIFWPLHKTPPNALKWPYKANLHHLAYTSRKPFHFLSSFYNIFIYYISSSFFLLIIIYIIYLVIIRVIIYILVLVISLLQALIVYTKR